MTERDICENRHGGADTSIGAFQNTSETLRILDRQKILTFMTGTPQGLTSKELAFLLDKPLNAISGRLSELCRDEQIEDSGERRDGCRVLRLKTISGGQMEMF